MALTTTPGRQRSNVRRPDSFPTYHAGEPRGGAVTRGFNAVSIHQDYFRTSMAGSGAWAW